jgi:hypothetical protein
MLIACRKTARIEPASLSRSTLPGRAVDYVVALKLDSTIDQAWRRLRPRMSIKSWNHTTWARRNPIAIHIETKGLVKSWTRAWGFHAKSHMKSVIRQIRHFHHEVLR